MKESPFLLKMENWGMRLICDQVAVENMVILNQNVARNVIINYLSVCSNNCTKKLHDIPPD